MVLIGAIRYSTTDLYVSASGSDSNPGTLLQPWQTIAKVNSLSTTGKTIHFRGGDRFEGSLALQSSTNYDSYGSGRATISGGKQISNWTLQGGGLNIWRATWNAGRPRALWVNGVRVIRARSTYSLPDSSTTTASGYSTAASANPGFMSTWGNVGDIDFVYTRAWRLAYCPVVSISGNTISMASAPFSLVIGNQAQQGWEGTPTFIENAYEIFVANAAAGSFYQDRTNGFVYLIPPAGVTDPNTAEVIAPILANVVTATGKSNVGVTNLEFAHTVLLDTYANGFPDIQSNMLGSNPLLSSWYKTDPAIKITNGDTISITRCMIRRLGTVAIGFDGLSVGCSAVGNIIYDISANGVQIGDPQQGNGACPSSITISDNVIGKCGQEFSGAVGIMQWYANASSITQNIVEFMPYTGISLGIGWGNEVQPNGNLNNTVSFNEVRDCMLLMQDGGFLYSNSPNHGALFDSNYLHDGRGASGVYLDDASEDLTVTNNIVILPGSMYFQCHNNLGASTFRTNTSDGGGYPEGSPNSFDALNVISNSAARAAGVALGTGPRAQYAAVRTEAASLIP